MTAHLYVLDRADGTYYVGSTTNLEVRVAEHQAGLGGDYTARRLPVSLVYIEAFPALHDAFLAERQVKGCSRAKKEAFMRGDLTALVALSQNRKSLRQAQAANQPPGQQH